MSYKTVEWDEVELSGELLAKDRCLRAMGQNETGFPKVLIHLRFWILLQASCRARDKIQVKIKKVKGEIQLSDL